MDKEELYRDKLVREARGLDKHKVVKVNGKRFEFQNALVKCGVMPSLTGREVKVLFVLNTYADKNLMVRIGHTAIARILGLHRENVARTTKALERKKLITCIYRGRTIGKKGKRSSNEYQLSSNLSLLNSVTSDTNATPQ